MSKMSKFSNENPFGTVGTFRKVSDEICHIEMLPVHQKMDKAVANPTQVKSVTRICYKFWNAVWKGMIIVFILLLLGYGVITRFGQDSGLSVSSSTQKFALNTSTTPFPEESDWSISTTIVVSQESRTEATSDNSTWITTTMRPETVEPAASTTTDLPLELDPSTTVRHPSTTTKWTIESMSEEERWDVRKRRPMYNPCARQLGDQVFMEVNWLCHYCQMHGQIWNKTEWEGYHFDSFPITCSFRCFDNKFRRACAKRAYEWHLETGEPGSPRDCKYCE